MISQTRELQMDSAADSRVRRFYESHRLLCWTLALIVMPLAILATWAYLTLLRSLPQTSGTLQVAGIQAPVTLSRDAQGVAHIRARHDIDAFYALGVAHAQDRLWQLEIQRRMTRGEMSDVFGEGSVQFDIFVRTLGIHQAAAASFKALSDDAKQALTAYAAGINSWMASKKDLPSEFTILRVSPQPWSPVDSLAWLKLFAFSMSLNYRQELDELSLALVLDEVKLGSLSLKPDDSAPVTVSTKERSSLEDALRLSALGSRMERFYGGGQFVGSNAWAISGRNTRDGRAIIANDPHLGLQIPSMWYAAAIQGERIDVAGMTLVGVPVVLLGRNRNIAWGATNMMADTQDLYFEQVSTDEPDRYRYNDEWLQFATRTETLHVRADFPAMLRNPLAPVQIKIRSTVNGPLISDVVGVLQQPVSLRWVGDSHEDTSYEAFLRANYATDWRTFNDAMALHVAPALNLVYIDAQQNIGYLGAGRVPIRGHGRGRSPLQGWVASNAWRGFVPSAELPRSFNPEKGYVISANNQVVDSSYPYFISEDWADPARAQRIEQIIKAALARGDKLSAAEQKAIQLDVLDLQAVKLMPELLSLNPSQPRLEKLRERLAKWDGRTSRDSVAATVFFTWLHHLRKRLFGDELRAAWGKPQLSAQLQLIVQDMSATRIQAALTDPAANWCDDVTSSVVESCAQVKSEALDDAYRDLQQLLGSDEDDWHWSSAQQMLFEHRPFSNLRGADLVYERRVANAGSPNSVNVAAGRYDRNEGFTQTYGAGFRQIMQLDADGSLHWYVNSTGQSGDVLSPHYDDMVEAYVAGHYFSLSGRERGQSSTLTLLPVHAAGGAGPAPH